MWLLLGALACTEEVLLPELRLPPDTLLQREWIPQGAERGLGRVERFDDQGCYRQGASTWLWVQDPLLARARDPWLFFNGALDAEPWFCLSDTQLWRLRRAVETLPLAREAQTPRGKGPLILRIAARWEGQERLAIVPWGEEHQSRATAELMSVLASLAAEGAWGGSPEPEEVTVATQAEAAASSPPPRKNSSRATLQRKSRRSKTKSSVRGGAVR